MRKHSLFGLLRRLFFVLAPIFSALLLAYAMPKRVGATLIKKVISAASSWCL